LRRHHLSKIEPSDLRQGIHLGEASRRLLDQDDFRVLPHQNT